MTRRDDAPATCPASELIVSAAHVFVDDLEALELTEADAHHLARTLRLRLGEAVTASDGAGRWRACAWRGLDGSGLAARRCLEASGPELVVAPPAPPVTVAFALMKGERPELVVRGLTEVGVDRIVPFMAARSVVRWDGDRATHHLERLRRIARGAAMQSRRAWLPEVCSVVTLAELVSPARSPASVMAHPGGGPVSLDFPTVLVGPEGGWDEAELDRGLALVGLGETVLRAETAALAAGVVLCSLRSGLVSQG